MSNTWEHTASEVQNKNPSIYFKDDVVKKLHGFICDRLLKNETTLSLAAQYHFEKPGKMLRAKMALHAASILKVNDAAALHWAAAIEILHNASLIHDDICDNDLLRRDRPSIWSKYGPNVALTLGDWLVALAFELAAEAGQRAQTPLLVKILAQHMATTTAGEASEFSLDKALEWDRYIEIASDKTAPLLTAPLEGVAAMALRVDASSSIGTYFRSLGAAYQIANDIMNFRALDGAVDQGSDLSRRAPNAVVVIYRESLLSEQLIAFDDWYGSGSNLAFVSWRRRILSSQAMAQSAHRMQKCLSKTAHLAKEMPMALSEAVLPIQILLRQVCLKATSPVNS
jgi:geranylgeranyl pyrophosphate synthase|tara:strand:- start:818 stop:1840 length:1023 start_codon:yes stop_codon:yes gene_type:complete